MSQKGDTIAEEAICFLSNRGANKADREAYLAGTYRMATDGHRLARKCASDFGDVRSTVFQVRLTVPNPFFLYLTVLQLIEKANQTQKRRWGFRATFKIMGPALTLKERVDVLEKLVESLEDYANWWGNMEIAHETLKSRNRSDLPFSDLRYNSILQTWVTFQREYRVYILQVRGHSISFIPLHLLRWTFRSGLYRTSIQSCLRSDGSLSGR